jgi:MoaA/NifB/PqqE/SkfB family radical SAM enzyme
MANIDLFVPVEGGQRCGNLLTLVVPASGGCNLTCPFCFVRQRRETQPAATLHPRDLTRFIHEAARTAPLFAVSLQGYEPLLAEAMEYTEAVLATALRLGIPAGLVTNGVRLREACGRLTQFPPAKIAVSLDAAEPGMHDHIRGVRGAWQATVDGIRHAVEVLPASTSLAVASVLQQDRTPLDAMPRRLHALGVSHWIVTPLQQIGESSPGGPVVPREKLYRDFLILQRAADDAGIHLTIDDELDCLHHALTAARRPELTRLPIRTLPAGVDLFRLTPGGHCSINRGILQQVTPTTPRWRPGEMDAGVFLESLKGRFAAQYAPAA